MLLHSGPHKYEAQSAKAFSLLLLPGFLFPREHGSGHLRFDVTDVPPQPNSQTVDNNERITETVHHVCTMLGFIMAKFPDGSIGTSNTYCIE